MIKIAIFASGTGSNAEKLLAHFKNHPVISGSLIASNKPNAGVLKHAHTYGIETLVFNTAELKSGKVLNQLQQKNIDYIILAGFLALIPSKVIIAYENRIINVHPSLLPKHGGKGMYGHFVHESVIDNNETKSGITIHLVNEEFDKGDVLFQATTRLNEEDNAVTVQKKVQVLEHQYFADVVESFILSRRG